MSVMSLIGKMTFFLLSSIAVGLCRFLSVRAKTRRNTTSRNRKMRNWIPKVSMKLLEVIRAKLVVWIAMAPFSN